MNTEWELEDSERDYRRQVIVEIAAQLFRAKGFKDTKLDEIASESQKGKTALYYYFKNKKSIFSAVVHWEASRIYLEIKSYTLGDSIDLAHLTRATRQSELPLSDRSGNFDSLAALERYVEKIVQIGDTFLRKYKSIFAEYNSFQKTIQSIIQKFKEQNIILLQAILRYGIAYGQLSLPKENVDLAAYAIFRICFTYFTDIMQGFDFQVGFADLKQIVLLLISK